MESLKKQEIAGKIKESINGFEGLLSVEELENVEGGDCTLIQCIVKAVVIDPPKPPTGG